MNLIPQGLAYSHAQVLLPYSIETVGNFDSEKHDARERERDRNSL